MGLPHCTLLSFATNVGIVSLHYSWMALVCLCVALVCLSMSQALVCVAGVSVCWMALVCLCVGVGVFICVADVSVSMSVADTSFSV